MKKFTILMALLIGFGSFASAEAKTAKFVVQTLTPLSTVKRQQEYLTFKVMQETVLDDISLEGGAYLRAKIVGVQNAQRGQRDAFLTARLIAYSVPSEDNKAVDVTDKNMDLKIKKYTPTDFAGMAMSAGTTVVSHVFKIPFLSQGIAVAKGVVDPIDGKNRLESVGVRLYESTPLTYASKGEELVVQEGEMLTVSYKWGKDDAGETQEGADGLQTESPSQNQPEI